MNTVALPSHPMKFTDIIPNSKVPFVFTKYEPSNNMTGRGLMFIYEGRLCRIATFWPVNPTSEQLEEALARLMKMSQDPENPAFADFVDISDDDGSVGFLKEEARLEYEGLKTEDERKEWRQLFSHKLSAITP